MHLFIILYCTLSFTVDTVAAQGYGESMVNDAIKKAKETVCRTIDGTIMDTKACDEYTKAKAAESEKQAERSGDKALELYHAAVAKLSAVLKNSKGSIMEFLVSQSPKGESAMGGAYQMVKSLKDTLTNAAGEVNSAFANLGASQSYVGDTQRWLMSVYNEFLEKLNLVGGEEEFVEKDFEGHEIREGKGKEKGAEEEEKEGKEPEGSEEKKEKEDVRVEFIEGLQEAYDKVSQAVAVALDKAYSKLKELGKEAVKATVGEEPLEMSSEKAQEAFGDIKEKSEDVLGKAKDAAEHLVEERLKGGGQEPKDLHDAEKQGEQSEKEREHSKSEMPILPGMPREEGEEDVETAEGEHPSDEQLQRPIEVL